MRGGLITYALTCGGGKPKLKEKTIYANGIYEAKDETVPQGEKKYQGYSKVIAALPLISKSITENGTYVAADEPVEQGDPEVAGYDVVYVNVVDGRIKEIQEQLFFEEYGHEYDPENPDPDEHYPTPDEAIDAVTDAETYGDWKYTLFIKFLGNYKTYESPVNILEGNDFSNNFSALSQESGCTWAYASGYPSFGDSIVSGAVPGQSDYTSPYKTAWFVYSIRITAKYREDENSPWVSKYDIVGKYANIWNSYENPEVYSVAATKVDNLHYDAGSRLLLEITP